MNFSAYRDHPLHSTLRRILELREKPIFATESVTLNEEYTYSRNKIFSIAAIIETLIRSTPEELVSISGINSINSYLQQVLAEINQYGVDENPARLNNASSFMDSVLASMWAFTPTAQPLLIDALPGLLQAQQKFAIDSVKQVADSTDLLSDHLDALTLEGEDLKSKLQEMSDSVARERAEASAALAKLDQTFTQAEMSRQQAFEDAIRAHREFYTEELKIQAYTASKTLTELDNFRDQAAKIVQVVGNIGVTGNYQLIANKEGGQANFWRWATVIIFGTGISIAMATFWKFWHDPFTQDSALSVLIRLFYAIIITSPAIYTAKESARHRTNSDRARQTELELASIGPFIELLPEDKKNEIRVGLTGQYFGKPVDTHTVSSPIDAASLASALKVLSESVLKAVKPGS
ncbi:MULTISPECIES: hypothetical protein [Pseudomonas syringae group]|uniref:Uncharacterized protein n=1 Tax=Pseudomonas syringae pv. primulae TaxID=251707 RepID=A0A0P9YZ50_9PSED|nr:MULTISPECIES: hypothetical protein [Pseudomonas syringae group]KPY39739.1 Uncharacterized protein ALO52_02884 [Pseudomonas syringae pv. primulae]